MLTISKLLIILTIAAGIGCSIVNSSSATADLTTFAPNSEVDKNLNGKMQTAVFGGGCFWGVEAVFEHVKGVADVRSGYSGGDKATANYDSVSDGRTDHAEAVIVTFDPAKITYVQLLTVFFTVAHDPTELNRQGPDIGTQYRSVIFYQNEDQKKLANEYIAAIDKSKALPKPIVTQVVPLKEFYDAEKHHQDYLKRHPNDPYIVYHDLPKLAALKEKYPDLYK